MKSKHFSMPGHSAGSHSSKRQNHTGHAHGHPTEHGHSESSEPNNEVGGPDYGSMAEHGLSEGNVKGLKGALPTSQCNNSILEEHELQHSDYGQMTGHNYNSTTNE